MKFYKIRNRKTGLYATSRKGKVWEQKHHALAHVKRGMDACKLEDYDLIELEAKEAAVTPLNEL